MRWPVIERVTAISAPDAQIEGWVIKPRHVRAPYKTILYIHGGPHAGFGLSFQADSQELVGAGYAVAYGNSRGSTGYGSAFSSSIIGCWGEPEEADFNAFLNRLVRLGIAHKDKLGVTGVSGGGYLSGWLIGHTHRFKAAVPEQGVYSMFSMWGVSDAGKTLITLEMGASPMNDRNDTRHSHRLPTHTNAEHQRYSSRVRTTSVAPWSMAEQIYQTIHETGCSVELLRLQGYTHGLEIAGPPPLRRFRMNTIEA